MATFSATEIADILMYENKGVRAELTSKLRSSKKPVLTVNRRKKHFFISLYVPSLEVIIEDLYKVGLNDADVTQIAYVFKALAGESNMKKYY